MGRGRLGRSKCLGATDQLWGKLARAGGGGWGGEGYLCERRGLWGLGLGGSQKMGPEPGRSWQVIVREEMLWAIMTALPPPELGA